MLVFLSQEMLKRNMQFSQQPFLSFDAQMTGFLNLSSAFSSCCPSADLDASPWKYYTYSFLRKFLGLPSQQSITVCVCWPVFISGLPVRTSGFMEIIFLYCTQQTPEGSVPSEHLVSSLPSPLCFWSWHFFMLRCIRDVTFFVDVLKCVLELFWLSTN